MNAVYEIHADRGTAVVTVDGSVTLPEFGAFAETIWSDPAWKPTYNGIIDFSAARIDLSEREVGEMTKAMATDPRCSFGRWALVVSTSADFAKLRKVDPGADLKSTLRIFFDRRSAEAWLLST